MADRENIRGELPKHQREPDDPRREPLADARPHREQRDDGRGRDASRTGSDSNES